MAYIVLVSFLVKLFWLSRDMLEYIVMGIALALLSNGLVNKPQQ
jgi:hypothetical protein